MPLNTVVKESAENEHLNKDMTVTDRVKTGLLILIVSVLSVYLMRPVLLGFCRRVTTVIGGMASDYTPGTHSVAMVTVPNEQEAKDIARYEWEGEINEDSELLLIIKTRTSRIPDVVKFVQEKHSFDVPEVISLPIEQGNAPYLKWLSDTVKQ